LTSSAHAPTLAGTLGGPMNRRIFILAACSAILSRARQAHSAKPPTIGVLSPGAAGPSPLLTSFREGLKEHGFVEGQNILLEYRFAETNLARLPTLAGELVARKVDVILAVNNTAAAAAAKATRTIPIVFTWAADPDLLVRNLARPEGNVTGLTSVALELTAKRFEIVKEALPGIARLAVVWNTDNAQATRMVKEMEDTSRQLALQVLRLGVRARGELEGAFREAARQRAGAVFVIEEASLLPHRAYVLDLAAQYRLPAASQYRSFAEAGGLLTYGADLHDLFRRAAIYVAKILRGAKPTDLPVEQPTKFQLVINVKTAKALGIAVPPSLLLRADQVIE